MSFLIETEISWKEDRFWNKVRKILMEEKEEDKSFRILTQQWVC